MEEEVKDILEGLKKLAGKICHEFNSHSMLIKLLPNWQVNLSLQINITKSGEKAKDEQ